MIEIKVKRISVINGWEEIEAGGRRVKLIAGWRRIYNNSYLSVRYGIIEDIRGQLRATKDALEACIALTAWRRGKCPRR